MSASDVEAARKRLDSAIIEAFNSDDEGFFLRLSSPFADVADMDDLRTVLRALATAEERAATAERLAAERLEALRRPAGMQEVRLAVGEGTLSPLDIIAGCNAEFRRRASGLTSGTDHGG